MTNPLLGWDTLPPFAHIKPEHVEPAVDEVLAENRAALKHLATLPAPDWQNFVESLESLGDRLHRAWAPVGHLNATMSTPELRAAYNACLPNLSEYSTELGQDERLQKAFLALKQGPAWAGYSPAQQKLVDDALLDFRLAGVDLPADKKARFKAQNTIGETTKSDRVIGVRSNAGHQSRLARPRMDRYPRYSNTSA